MKISVIVCTKNSAKYLDKVLESISSLNPYKIIVVDAISTDNTVKIALKYKAHVVFDQGKGLAAARNIGVLNSTGDYNLFMGPDNAFIYGGKKVLETLVDKMNYNKWDGIGLRSEIYSDNKNYFTNGLNQWWKTKIKPGKSSVIGTPFLFKKDVWFDESVRYCDDTELCKSLNVGYTNRVLVYDIWMGLKQSVINRFRMYGISDREFYNKNKSGWTIGRKIKSILHPLNEFKMIQGWKDVIYIPFAIMIVAIRYYGWIRG